MNVARTATSAVADRIRIEDEVWNDAFASRVSSRPRRGGVPKSRPAQNWFADPNDQPRPYGVDPPAELEAPFGIDPFDLDPAQDGGPSAAVHDLPPSVPGVGLDAAEEEVSGTAPARRTIRIQGRGAERNLPVTRPGGYAPAASHRRTSLLDHGSGFEPDRVAMWAMLLGVALVAVAILSSSL